MINPKRFRFISAFLLTLFSVSLGSAEDLTYTGKYLRELRVPVGGVGTGNILMGGRGDIQHIEVFNRPNRGRQPVYTFFTLRVRSEGEPAVSKILERELLPPYTGATHRSAHGLPRMDEVTFTNSFPIPHWSFQDPAVPLEIELEVINPFIPTHLDDSAFPVAAFYWTLENPTAAKMEVSLALNMENPIPAESILNEAFYQGPVSGVRFSSVGETNPNHDGALLMATTHPEPQIQTHWYDGRWRDDLHIFWDDFSQDGSIEETRKPWESTSKPLAYNEVSNRNSTVLVRFTLAPGESRRIPFYLSWYFPRQQFTLAETFGNAEAADIVFSNYYFTRFSSEAEALQSFLKDEARLVETTGLFARALQDSTYSRAVIEALNTQAATLKTNLIQIDDQGRPHGFEGVFDTSWCCPGSCTHVYNYAQTIASLFPEVERGMREIEFLHNTFDNGFQAHRSLFPLGPYWFNGPAAADGQMGTIIRAYREWKLSGDTVWLAAIWPEVKKTMLFAWEGPGTVIEEQHKHQENQDAWDPNRTGIMTGRQHNTYDISFFGPNSMTSSLYLGALKASSRMAEAMGEPELAAELERVYQSGMKRFEDLLWNGDYFIQIIETDPDADASDEYELTPTTGDNPPIPKYQYGDGCLADQLLGQYLAHVSGLGYILDSSKVDRAMQQIYTHNFIRDLSQFENEQRVYALNNEAGVVLCTWPRGNQPLLPFVYSDEIWSGVEYQVAASLIYSGLVDEGLAIVEAIHHRHDGYKRNPFEHDESGVHYARAMASWSLLLSLSGIDYDGVKQSLAFTPRVDTRPFKTFWSTGNAWGTYTLNEDEANLEVLYGQLELKSFEANRSIRSVDTDSDARISNNSVLFPEGILLKANDSLNLQFSP